MKQRAVVFAAVLAIVAAALAGSASLYARMLQDDDRPPIVVRGGSIYFDGGDKDDPAKCCNNWKKDLIGKQWKPKPDNKSGVRAFAVTVDGVPPAVCSMTALEAPEVFIDYREASQTLTFKVYIQAKVNLLLFFVPGKHEPKIDSPVDLKNEPPNPPPGAPAKPGRLEYGHDKEGYISRLKAGATECQFNDTHKPVIKIQPKSDQ
jgi:hypothetical protein